MKCTTVTGVRVKNGVTDFAAKTVSVICEQVVKNWEDVEG